MKINSSELKILLVGANLMSSKDFDKAVKGAAKKKKSIDEYLPQTELITDSQLGQLIANYHQSNFVSLSRESINEEVLNIVPELVAINKKIIAFDQSKDGLKLAMTDPKDKETIHIIEKRSGQKVIPYFATNRDLKLALDLYRSPIGDEFDKILADLKKKSLSREDRDERVSNIVDMLIEYGHQNKASDIHIEPMRLKVKVRFRIDGIMHKMLDLPKDLYDLILSRIKIMAKMRTDEHRAAQDGKLRYTIGKEDIDIRISVVPIVEGENVVMRLLSSKGRDFSLANLGVLDNNLKILKKAMKKPHGMILVTGPTGSGKTTTLYSIMKKINKPEVHISTIEDPVEYDLDGISQIQVNKKTDLTFAKGLRAIVRQDPDIIMIGEIRDSETAGIAVNSAMTGHLVLSTLHTNDAPTALPRLLDMKIEPFLVSSTVNIIIAQRLVRKICERCRESLYVKIEDLKGKIPEDLIEKIAGDKKEIHCYHSTNGCKSCGQTGYVGRIGIFEVLEMTDEIKKLVINRSSSIEIMASARANGMTTMMEDGMHKVLAGVTTIEEVLRTTME